MCTISCQDCIAAADYVDRGPFQVPQVHMLTNTTCSIAQCAALTVVATLSQLSYE